MASITKFTRGIARKAKGLIKKKKNRNQTPALKPKIAVRWLAEEPAQFLGPFCGLWQVFWTLSDYNIKRGSVVLWRYKG
ncbi:hypothetical protein PspLS_07095 [Pyricularia sp. CBS 133598]|nr:hypothetical protein PspLS_07095 [Pyricularia sp. CBS 133598]